MNQPLSPRPRNDRTAIKAWIRAHAPHVCAGIMAADAANYGHAVDALEQAGFNFLHFDIMDGVFCPQLTAGPGLVKALRTDMIKDVHLMVSDPLAHIASFIAAGADILHIHAESAPVHLHRVFADIDQHAQERPVLRGVALNPGTALEIIRPVLHRVDLVTVLAVDPGWSSTLSEKALADRIATLRILARETGADPLICIDGGITPATYTAAAALTPDLIVSGSALFRKEATITQNLNTLIGASI